VIPETQAALGRKFRNIDTDFRNVQSKNNNRGHLPLPYYNGSVMARRVKMQDNIQ
jgi:hypothetical protein